MTNTRKPRIVWTDRTGRTRLYGSARDLDAARTMLDTARAFLGRSLRNHADYAAMDATLRIEW